MAVSGGMGRFFALIAAAFLLSVNVAFGQVVTGAILGRVTDSTGAVVSGTVIQVQNSETGFARTEQTDREGRYASRNLPLGSYSVSAHQAGFRTEVRRGIVLAVASEVVIDLQLSVGAVEETVEVISQAPLIETTSATVSGLVSPDQMRDLPLNGRSVDQLALLSPGVFANKAAGFIASQGMGLRLSVNGGRPDANLYLLDGTVVNDHSTNGPGSAAQESLGVEGILEFRLLTHSFSAEYGRNSGGVVSAVTRSGTNDFHGSAYEFVRNNVFDARNFFNPGALPAFRRNQFGASLGGRVIRDRMFFFANYEGLRQRQGSTVIATVPDRDARQGLVPDPNTRQLRPVPVNPAARPYLNLYPLPNGRNFGDGTAEFISNFSARANEDYAMERMDFQLSDKDNFYWRYVFDPSESTTPRPVPIFQDNTTATNNFVALSETHVFSGASLNEFRFAFNRTDPAVDSSAAAAVDPALSFVAGQRFGTIRYASGGSSAATTQLTELGTSRVGQQNFAQNLFQETDTFTSVRGSHSLKAGADFERIQLNILSGSFVRGAYTFGGLQDLLTGQPPRFDILLIAGASNTSRGWRRNLFGWFVQDDYHLRPNLTLNLGFRHEFFTSPAEVNGRSANLRRITDPQSTLGPPFEAPKANFAPRVGLAWDPTGSGKTSVRIGAGVYYNHVDGRTWYTNAGNDAHFLASYTLTNPIFPNGLANRISAQLQRNDTVQFHIDTPTVIHYNMELQRQLAHTLSIRLGYVGSSGHNMTRLAAQNIRIPQILADGSKFFAANAPLVNPNYSDIQQVLTDAHSNYNGLQIVVQKTLSAGLRFQTSYSVSKAFSDSDAISNQQTLATAPSSLDKDNLARDYSLSGYDQRQTLVLNGQYQMPWDKHLNGRYAKALLGGWAVNGIFSYGSGLPFNVQVGFNNSRNSDSNQPDRPNLAAGAKANPITGTTAGCQGIPAGQKLRTPDRYLDPCAFELSPAGTFGNLGRNTVTGPTLFNTDFTLVKSTPLTEKKKLEFRAEFFDLLNHANFGLPNRTVFNSTRNHSGNEGRITNTSTDAREIQLGLKLTF